jgi:integrase
MVKLQLVTGARPGEVSSMTLGDIDKRGPVWIYRPSTHKSEHKGKSRIIPLGPKAQLLLKPWLLDFPGQFVFRSIHGSQITVMVYRQAISRACEKAGVDVWSPNQLRHAAATKIREQSSLDAAQVILGHSTVATTQIYAERNLDAALAIASKIG